MRARRLPHAEAWAHGRGLWRAPALGRGRPTLRPTKNVLLAGKATVVTQDVKGEPSKRCGAGSGAGQVARARSPGGTLPPSGAKLGPLPPPTAALPAAAPCPRSWLKLKTQFGENVLIVESETSDFGAIRSGDNVAIKGVWLSRGAGGVRAVSGHTRADSSYCFVGTGLEKVTTKARNLARPAVACERRGGGSGGWAPCLVCRAAPCSCLPAGLLVGGRCSSMRLLHSACHAGAR